MKNTVKSLVLIWLTTFSTPVLAGNLFSTESNVERMYIAKNDAKKSESYIVADGENSENITFKSSEKSKKKDEDLPRLKRLYIAAYAGYFYTTDSMEFEETKKCGGSFQSLFFCANGVSNPVVVDYNDDYFLSGAFGINSANMLRLELSYFRLGKEIAMEGMNQVAGVTQKYASSIDLTGGSINLYFDLVGDRRLPYLVFVPYVMAGIGASQIDLGDVTFTDTNSTTFTLGGKDQRNKTVVYGAGFSAGLNNYISLDIGYRYYDFGVIKTDVGMSNGTEVFDIQLESELKAHVATVGLKLQI